MTDTESPRPAVEPSEQLQAERRHQDLADHLRLALDAAALGTWRWDLASGEVVWDPHMEQLFGFEPGGFTGTFDAYAAALHPDDRADVVAAVEEALERRGRYQVEHRVVLPDGEVRWIRGAGMITTGADGEPTGAIGCSLDITDRVEVDRALRAALDDAEAAAERERTDRERFEFLTAINEALAEASSRREIMAAVTRAAVPKLGDWCSIYVLTDDGGRIPEHDTFHVDPALVEFARELTERYPFDPDAPTGMASVIRTGEPEFYPEITVEVLDDALERSGYEGGEAEDLRGVIDQLALRSAITVPLVKAGRILGGLSFVNTTARRAFTRDDLALAEVVASRVASSLENRRLTDAQRRIAATLQASLLPARLPDVPCLDVAVRYWAAGEATTVGGDFYDLFAIDDGRWAAVIGDVCGTGAKAASLTGLARHTIRLGAWLGLAPVDVVRWLNRAVRESLASETSFLTVAYLTLAPAAGGFDVTVTRAGHPAPVVVRAVGEPGPLGTNGGLVGVFDEVMAATTCERLEPGDALVLYTDGLNDVPPPHDLDLDQTVELIAEAARGCDSAEQVAEALETLVQQRLELQRRPDDIAVVVLRATAPGRPSEAGAGLSGGSG